MEVKDLVRVVWCNEPVLTSAQLATIYGCSTDTLKHNFQRAREQFKEGEHYFKVSGAALRALKEDLNEGKKNHLPAFSKMASCLYLWTHKGCVRHCKMINTPEAWKMFDELERVYFGVMKNALPAPAEEEPPTAENEEVIRLRKQLAGIEKFEFAVVYFLLMGNGTVKIGYTKDLTERVKQIKAETRLEVLQYKTSPFMSLDEARALEAALKEKYAADCLGGEYFDVRFVDIIKEL